MPILGTDNAKRPVMSDPRCGMRMRALDSEAMDLAQMVMEIWKQNCVYHPIKLLFQQCGKIVIPWESPLSMYYSLESKGLALAQMAMDIQYQIKSHSLGLSIVRSQTLDSEASGLRPDDHSQLQAAFSASGGQAGCNGTPNLT